MAASRYTVGSRKESGIGSMAADYNLKRKALHEFAGFDATIFKPGGIKCRIALFFAENRDLFHAAIDSRLIAHTIRNRQGK